MTTFQFMGETLTLDASQAYGNGATAVFAVDADGMPFAKVSVNLPQSAELAPGQFYLKDYSENTQLAAVLIESGLIEAVNPFLAPPVQTGFVTVHAYALTGEA